MTRRENRPNAAQLRLLNRYQRRTEAIALSRFIGERVARGTWFKAPDAPRLTARPITHRLPPSGLGDLVDSAVRVLEPPSMADEADLLLNKPTHTGDRRTVRFAGKPYHFRQDYTGQLKLAAGESPW